MGSTISRNLRDLFEVAGCDGIAPLDTSQNEGKDAFDSAKDLPSSQTHHRPVTPIPHHRTRMLSQDPRSPSFGIPRTPIEVVATPDSSKCKAVSKVECMDGAVRNYLETDLDSFDDVKADPSTPVLAGGQKLPPGLSATHLLKLKFLGLDPRSPSEGIIRTPIQVLSSHERHSSEDSLKESSDVSSASLSRSLFGSSEESLDISKACSEPSALVSDYDRSKDWSLSLDHNELEQKEPSSENIEAPATVDLNRETPENPASTVETEFVSSADPDENKTDTEEHTVSPVDKTSSTPILCKATNEVIIFCEDSTRTPQNTPKKKSMRTPLTPICNMTPSDVIRGKKIQGKRLDKESKKLVCKVLSGCENTPTKQTTSLIKKGKKTFVDENVKLGDWDQDTTVII